MSLLTLVEVHPGSVVTVLLFVVSLVLGLVDAARVPERPREPEVSASEE